MTNIPQHSDQSSITVSGKHVDVGSSLKEYAEAQIISALEKYFGREGTVTVTFGYGNGSSKFLCHIHVHAGKDTFYESNGENSSARHAFDQAMERIAKQLRRHKRAQREDKHRGHSVKEDFLNSLEQTM